MSLAVFVHPAGNPPVSDDGKVTEPHQNSSAAVVVAFGVNDPLE